MNQSEKHASSTGDWRKQPSNGSGNSKVSSIQRTVSHKLTDAANALREKSDAFAGQNRELAGYGNMAAGLLDRSADYLEELDPQQLKSGLEHQVRHHPGRSLLIATAAGLVIGALIRRR